ASRVESCLQLNIERAGADATAVHRAQHLNISDGIETEATRNAMVNQLDDARHRLIWVRGRHEVEVRLAIWWQKVWQAALIDLVSAGNDFALCGLTEHLRQPHDRNSARADD